jgi:asparagine synthase (glutamine-hydrolysing)
MCGIAGICRTDGQAAEQALLARMAALIRHRGPDDEGFYRQNGTGFAFRRLAILDLSPAGHQPMSDEDGTCWLVFNGEIYNYRELAIELVGLGHTFRSRTDSETVLHAYQQWGVDCLAHFRGMFAFALWDERRQMLFAARDRFGIKPFCYHLSADRLLFGSEIKALWADPATPNRPNDRRLYDYLVYGYLDHTDETCFEGIKQLPPAHFLTFADGHLHVERYWNPAPTVPDTPTDARAAAGFRELFFESVRLHLQSDVPIGSCLSGGLDSSAIVCTVNQLLTQSAPGIKRTRIGERQRTFTAYFDNPNFDERPYAAQVIEQTKVQPFFASPAPGDLFDLLPRLLWHQEEPFVSSSLVAQWTVMQSAREHGVTVMLDGQGGDEMMGGYPAFFSGLWGSLLRRGDLPRLAHELAAYRKWHGAPPSILLASAANLAAPAAVRAAFKRRARRRHPEWLGQALTDSHSLWLEPQLPHSDPLQERMYEYTTSIHLPALLHYEDRNSMAFGIEARVPFLDHRLAEFMFALPPRFKLRDGRTKWALREGLCDLLPAGVLARQDKMGFVTPESEWLRTTLREPVGDIFASARFRERPYWQAGHAQRILAEHAQGQADHHTLIWHWFITELWLRDFIDRRPTEPGIEA